MSAIETCRTAALGGHVERCEDCAHERVAYNSCRERHCRSARPPRRGNGSNTARPGSCGFPINHVEFTLPAAIGVSAFQNKGAVYDLLF